MSRARTGPVRINRYVRIIRPQQKQQCSAGHYWLTLRRVGFPSPRHINRLDQKPADQARYVILSCPYCANIINGQGEITCFGGRKSYYLVFYAICNMSSSQPRAKAAWNHLLECDHCKEWCLSFEIFQQQLDRKLSEMSWPTRRRLKKQWRQHGILA